MPEGAGELLNAAVVLVGLPASIGAVVYLAAIVIGGMIAIPYVFFTGERWKGDSL